MKKYTTKDPNYRKFLLPKPKLLLPLSIENYLMVVKVRALVVLNLPDVNKNA